MNTASATAFFTDLASEGKTPPEWVELFPKGPHLKARDGREWTLEPARVVSAFAREQVPLAIDYEHGQALLAAEGREAPAAAWITKVEERDGAVWGKVEWTKSAAAKVSAKEYRFLSPDFDHTRDGLILKLNGAGLVNRPALVMTALSRNKPQPPENNDMSLKAIAAKLGLKDDADEKAVLAALDERDGHRKALCANLKIDEASDAQAIASAVTKLQGDTETALAAVKASPAAADVAALKTTLADTQTALAALQKKDADREVDAALDAAAAAGKITPASRETYRAMCAVDGGLERFKALAATLPVICEPTGLNNASASTRTAEDDLNPKALAGMARKYQDDQAALGVTVSMSEAVEHVKAAKA
ncbi:phage protease [Shinella sp.]|uniref:phage protease n=1 Tax=Shinella sp. TaxID=1870904 RepID=UPI0039E57799